jgi:AcrR family transcriptional regulator
MTTATPIQDRAIATRQRILDAAQTVAVAKGAFRATTADVASAAGVSIGTVYRYFEDMPAILHELGWTAVRITRTDDEENA